MFVRIIKVSMLIKNAELKYKLRILLLPHRGTQKKDWWEKPKKGENMGKKANRKNRGRRKILLIGAIIVSISCIAAGAMFTYYMQTDQTHSVGRLWEITHNAGGSFTTEQEMGDYDITFDTSDMVGGDTESFLFNVSLSGNSNANKPLYFTLTNNYESNGVNVSVTNLTLGTIVDDTNKEDSVTFTAGETIQFEFEVSLDEYTPEGTYSVSLLLEKN